LKSLFPTYADKFETVIVEDVKKPDAYDNVVQGVDIVVHMASPLPGTATDYEGEILIPARDGIVNMLKAASKAPTVRRVVTTSSSVAVVDRKFPEDVPYVC